MKAKWQFFVVGLLCGFLIAGIAILIVSRTQRLNMQASLNFEENMELTSTTVSETDKVNANSEGNLGRIDLNRATIEDLMTLPNIGETKARAIIDFRDTYGDFERIDELLYVSGIGPEIFKGLEDLIYIQ